MAKANKVAAPVAAGTQAAPVAVYAGSNPPPAGATACAGKVQYKALPGNAWLVVTAAGKRYTGKPATKHGMVADNGDALGTAGTWGKVLAAAAVHGGYVTVAELAAVAAACNDKGYAAYAMRSGWLAPVAQ